MNKDMLNLLHFFVLVGEYSFLPLALWFLTYLPKIQDRDESVRKYGYEFVLIQAFVFLAITIHFAYEIFLEIHCLDITLACISLLSFIVLMGLYFYGYFSSEGHIRTIKQALITYYSAFFSWWLTIAIFIAASVTYINLWFDSIVVIIFAVSFYVMKTSGLEYLINWKIWHMEMVHNYETGYYKKVEKIGTGLLRKFARKEGNDNLSINSEITLVLARTYYLQRVKDGKVENGIATILAFLEHPTIKAKKDKFNLMPFLRLLAALCSFSSQEQLAIKFICEFAPKEQQKGLINRLKAKDLDNLFLTQ